MYLIQQFRLDYFFTITKTKHALFILINVAFTETKAKFKKGDKFLGGSPGLSVSTTDFKEDTTTFYSYSKSSQRATLLSPSFVFFASQMDGRRRNFI